MSNVIRIEDLAANAFIDILDNEKNNEDIKVTFSKLEEHGKNIIKYLHDKGEKAFLSLSRNQTCGMFYDYSKYFKEAEDGKAIELREGITVDDLIVRFRTYLSLELLDAFINVKFK